MSQLDSQTTTIGDYKFEVFKLDPLVALDVQIDIMQAIAPAFGGTVSLFEKQGYGAVMDADVSGAEVGQIINAFISNISKEKLRELINTMAGVTHCNGKELKATFQVVFRGDLPLMYQWLWFALKVNFENFIDWMRTAIQGALAKVRVLTESASQTTSKDTGQS